MRHPVLTALLLVAIPACATTSTDGDDADTSSGDGKADGDGSSHTPPAGCTGLHVPGDYATLQLAITAAAGRTADSTICLATGDWSGPANPASSNAFEIPEGHDSELHIVGAGRDTTRLRNSVIVGRGWAKVRIEGVTIANSDINHSLSVFKSNTPVELVDSRTKKSIVVVPGVGPTHVLVERNELGTNDNGGSLETFTDIAAGLDDVDPAEIVMRNNYVHGGVYASASFPTLPAFIQIDVVNNTFVGTRGVNVTQGSYAFIANNIFSGATSYALKWEEYADVTVSHNAFWNNAVDFVDNALPSQYDMFDCAVDTSGPVPTLGTSAACRDAGDPYAAPADDYFGHERAGRPDIGAVEVE